MRFDYIDPFVSTTIRVLDGAIRCAVRRGDVSVLQGNRIKGEVAVQVNITGDAQGDVILSMDTNTALKICGTLFGRDFDAMSPSGTDALLELANMITGNAVSALNDQGFDFSVSPPSVITRDGGTGSIAAVESLEIPLFSDCGEMTMNVVLGTE
jgi:chemotaxis protein CheX